MSPELNWPDETTIGSPFVSAHGVPLGLWTVIVATQNPPAALVIVTMFPLPTHVFVATAVMPLIVPLMVAFISADPPQLEPLLMLPPANSEVTIGFEHV